MVSLKDGERMIHICALVPGMGSSRGEVVEYMDGYIGG